jgi:hypothetical protein
MHLFVALGRVLETSTPAVAVIPTFAEGRPAPRLECGRTENSIDFALDNASTLIRRSASEPISRIKNDVFAASKTCSAFYAEVGIDPKLPRRD